METTIIIAKVLGVYLAVSGIFIITHKRTLGLLIEDLFKNRAVLYLIGAAMLSVGSSLVLVNWEAEGGLSIFVAIMAWAILVKGLMYIFVPHWLHAISRRMSKQTTFLIGVATALLGLYLLFLL